MFQSEQNLNEDNPEEPILEDNTVPQTSKDTSDKGELTSLNYWKMAVLVLMSHSFINTLVDFMLRLFRDGWIRTASGLSLHEGRIGMMEKSQNTFWKIGHRMLILQQRNDYPVIIVSTAVIAIYFAPPPLIIGAKLIFSQFCPGT